MDATADESAPAPAPGPTGPPSRAALAAVVVGIAALVIANNIGNASAPVLLPVPNDPGRSSNPELLLALSPAIRNQVGVVNYVAPWTFLLLAGARLLVADPLFYLLGRWYGSSAIAWMEKRSANAGAVLRQVERLFARASVVLVFIAANNLVCLLAGAARMRPWKFWAANVAGTLTRLMLIMFFADLLSSQIDAVLDFVGAYRPWILGLSVAVVAVVVARQLRGGSGELGQIRRLGSSLRDDSPTGTPSGGSTEGERHDAGGTSAEGPDRPDS